MFISVELSRAGSALTVGSVLPDEVSVETLIYNHFSVVHPHQLHTDEQRDFQDSVITKLNS